MKNSMAGCLTAALLLGVGSFAHAQSGPYLGVGVGLSKLDLDAGDVNATAAAAGITGNTTNVDDSDTGYKVYGGWRFNKYFAAEVSYADLGEASATFVATAPTAANLSVSADASSFAAAVVGMYPVTSKIDLFAKAGFQRWDVDGTATAVVGGTAVSASADDDGTDALFGLGAGYNFTPNVGVRLEWERYNDVSDTDVDLFSGGLYYRF